MGTVTLGIDVGQKVDPTALAVADENGGIYAIRFLERLEIGTPYPDVARRVGEVCRKLLEHEARQESRRQLMPLTEDMRRQASQNIWVVCDATGVGVPVVEMIVAELEGTYIRLCPVFFTHGDKATIRWGGRRESTVGKAYLVSRLQALIQTQRIELPQTAEAKALAKELQDYEIRIDAATANDTYGAFKVGSHDDLVTALGLATIVDRPTPRDAISFQG